MEKVVRKAKLSKFDEVGENLKFWLSRSPEERIEAVHQLRKHVHGTSERLQRVARVVRRASR